MNYPTTPKQGNSFRSAMSALIVSISLVCVGLPCVTAQESGQSNYSKGLTAFMNASYGEALEPFELALQADPNDPRTAFFIGLCLNRLGDADAGAAWFHKAAALENTAAGRLFNVSAALQKVQGPERILIEDIRQQARVNWQRQEEARQIQLFGQTLNREKSIISEQNRFEKPTPVTLSNQEGKTVAGSVPSIAPISPLSHEEEDATKVPNLYDENNSEFQYFRDELGKTTLSTSQQERLREQESRVKYADPMDIPAKDGSPFINIYDPSRVVKDEEPFFGLDDPDDVYSDFEAGPLQSTTTLIDMAAQKFGGGVLGLDDKDQKNEPGGMPGMTGSDNAKDRRAARRESRRSDRSSSGMSGMGMPGMGMSGMGPNGEKEDVANPDDDTDLIFGKTNASPKTTEAPEAPADGLNPFEADRNFTAEPPVDESENKDGMPGMGGMGMPPM